MSTQVQGTNDSSIVSKHSIVQQGYFKDPYIRHFVNKYSRRSPLINLGYYVRAVVIEKALLQFIESELTKKKCQILSLGAGFDTSYFRLSDLPSCKNVTYFEIDLPEVVRRKAAIILSCEELKSRLKNLKDNYSDCGLWSDNYRMFAGDLRDLTVIKNALRNYNFDVNKPTLILCECSITYMDEMSSRELIKFINELLRDAVFVTYEQITPDDGFGIVMTDHFKTINSPLLSISSYPTLADQETRFLNCGWSQSCAVSVWEAFFCCTTEEERFCALGLEPFDEWEELHSKCNHYALVVAGKGSLQSWLPHPNFRNFVPQDGVTLVLPELELYSVSDIKLFGHCSVLYSNSMKEYIFNIGGFGQTINGSHGRLKNISCFELVDNKFNKIETISANNFDFDFMHHTCTFLEESISEQKMSFVLFGGRKSPNNCVNSTPKLVRCRITDDNILVVETSELLDDFYLNLGHVAGVDIPESRWRHTACITQRDSLKVFNVFGGCSQKLKVFDDHWEICLNVPPDLQYWRKISHVVDGPCGRFAHSVCTDVYRMYVSGGLNNKFEALSDIWMWNCIIQSWLLMPVSNVLPRYGHTSHVISNPDISRSWLILVGGVSTRRERRPGIAVISLDCFVCCEYTLPGHDPVRSLMLHNHSSVLRKSKESIFIVGGGGNCFSFGTKFNSVIVRLPMEML